MPGMSPPGATRPRYCGFDGHGVALPDPSGGSNGGNGGSKAMPRHIGGAIAGASLPRPDSPAAVRDPPRSPAPWGQHGSKHPRRENDGSQPWNNGQSAEPSGPPHTGPQTDLRGGGAQEISADQRKRQTARYFSNCCRARTTRWIWFVPSVDLCDRRPAGSFRRQTARRVAEASTDPAPAQRAVECTLLPLSARAWPEASTRNHYPGSVCICVVRRTKTAASIPSMSS